MDQLLLRADEVMRILGLGRSKTYELMQTDLPVVRIGRSVRVARAELEAWVRANTSNKPGARGPATGIVPGPGDA